MAGSFLIKVCGLVDPADAEVARDAGADRLGMVFAPSPRRVDPAHAATLVRRVPAAWVGVFVDPDPAAAADLAQTLGLAAIQLHGDESPETCRQMREAAGREVWKAVRWTGDPGALAAYDDAVDRLLLDPGAGTGARLPWEAIAARLSDRPRRRPLLVAGGLDADVVGEAIAALRPDGVDASSRLERTPGRKDPDRVRAFVAAARAAAAPAVR